MHNVYTSHIFIVYNSVICIITFNILSILYNGHIAFNYTGYFCVYSTEFIFYIHWILDFKYILLLVVVVFIGR